MFANVISKIMAFRRKNLHFLCSKLLYLGLFNYLVRGVPSEAIDKSCRMVYIGKTDHELFHKLNDPSLTADDVYDILNSIVDKDNVWIGPNSVEEILSVSKLQLENCDVLWQQEFLRMQKVFEEGEYGWYKFKWDKTLNQGFNYGLARFLHRYLPKLMEYCRHHGGLIFMRALRRIGEEDKKRAEALAEVFPIHLETMRLEDVMKCKDTYLMSNNQVGIENIKNSCKHVGAKLNFAKEFEGPAIAGNELSGVPEGLLAKWTRIKRVCEILFRALNKKKGPLEESNIFKSKSILFKLQSKLLSRPKLLIRSKSMSKLRIGSGRESPSFKPLQLNDDLDSKLNDTSLSVEQVDAILEAVENKDIFCIRTLTANFILSIKIHSIDNRSGNQLSRFEATKDWFGEKDFRYGLNIFYQHYWTKLIQYCGQNIGQILDAEEAAIGVQNLNRIGKFVSTIEAKRITVRDVSIALEQSTHTFAHWFFYPHYTRSWLLHFQESCDILQNKLQYLELLSENIGSKLSGTRKDKVDYFLRAKKVCFIYLDDPNRMSPRAIARSNQKLEAEKGRGSEKTWWS